MLHVLLYGLASKHKALVLHLDWVFLNPSESLFLRACLEIACRLQQLLERLYFEGTCVQEIAASWECVLPCREIQISLVKFIACSSSVAQTKEQIQRPAPFIGRRKMEGSLGFMLDLDPQLF